MNTEQLLIPRYEVIADYPDSSFSVGQIIKFELLKTGDWVYRWAKHDGIYEMSLIEFKEYPHLFKPLPWYHGRKIEEMPEYVKWNSSGNVSKVLDTIVSHTNGLLMLKTNEVSQPDNRPVANYCPVYWFTPALESDYIAFINREKNE